MADAAQALHERVRVAVERKTPLRFCGGGSKDFFGGPLQGEVVDTRAHTGIIDHDPPELVITARCGTPLSDIETALSHERQMLPFEPPHFARDATIGGCIAAGLSGPRRISAGTVRDFVLGATILNGRGEVLRFGGRVMKNVAGYDVARLMAGSLGTLGLILDVSIKVLPVPPAEVTLVFELPQAQALKRCCEWAGRPLPISATAWVAGTLFVRLSGAMAAVEKASTLLGGDVLDAKAQPWATVREHRHAFFDRGDCALLRCALPANQPPLPFEAATLFEWNGTQRWLQVPTEDGETFEALIAQVRRTGGHTRFFRRDDSMRRLPLDDLDAASLAIHRRLKRAFDPAGIFNPARLHPEF